MSLVDSNTFIEPTAGTSLNTARSQFNNAIRSLLTNFRSSSAPTTGNITASGAGIGEQNGMLFHMANSNVSALFISDSVHKKSAKVGGNFTRVGIGNRVENGIVAMKANAAHYEVGELTATVSDLADLKGNARLYLATANNGAVSDFIDVGIPPTNGSVVNTMIAVNGVTADKINLNSPILIDATVPTTTSAPLNRGNAHLKIKTTDGTNTSILLDSTNTTSNVSIVKLHGGVAEDAGLSVFDQSSKYAPVSANILSQSTIQGTDTVVAPLMPAGSVIIWTTGTAPDGWLLCNGAAINRTTYCTTKFAIEGFTKALSLELAKYGIRVNTVCPTFIKTPMTKVFFKNKNFEKEVISKIPLKRLGEIKDLMGPFVFLASDASSLITGSSILVDGGWTAQ